MKEASGDVAAAVISYGKFIQTVIDSTIIAFVIFIVIKAINSQKRKQEEIMPPPEPSKEELLLSDIRDILKIIFNCYFSSSIKSLNIFVKKYDLLSQIM